MMRHARTLGGLGILLLTACSRNGAVAPPSAVAAACTFANPVAAGADPWVVRHGGSYFLAQSRNGGIWVSKSARLEEMAAAPVRVWTAPDTGWNHMNIWAPELHHFGAHWYIYYAAGRAGPPFIHQRAGVLESVADDPQGVYLDKGMMYTGDSIATGNGNVWAIDLTVAQINGQLYAVWSGWQANAFTDRTPQQLYAARMLNPWTIGTNRVMISAPTESWELGTELNLQEGPEYLTHGTSSFIIYSTRESWLPSYQLGQIGLATPSSDPLNPASWIKRGPVFTGTSSVYGVGHASFTTSPDGAEDWIAYHSKVSPSPGWNRNIRTQKFTWNPDNSPNFGIPVVAGQPLRVPSGECQ
ncbi:MAG: hypothetical protein NVS4B3_25360 [Gemmatimonadaceae bacterium]